MLGSADWTSRVGLSTKKRSWSRWSCQVRSSIATVGCGPVALTTTTSIGPSS